VVLGRELRRPLALDSFGTDGGGKSLVFTMWDDHSPPVWSFCFLPIPQLVADFDSGGSFHPQCGGGLGPSYVLAAATSKWPETVYGSSEDVNENVYLDGLLEGWREISYSPPFLIGRVSSAGRFVNSRPSAQVVAVDAQQSILAVYDPGAVQVCPGYSCLGLIPPPEIVHTGWPHPVVTTTADFNGDGNLDIAVLVDLGYSGGNDETLFELHPGLGDGTFGTYTNVPTRASWGSANYCPETCNFVAVEDFNGDRRPDLVNVDPYATPGELRYVTVLLSTTGHGFPRPAVELRNRR
jgi:hypothetical protein